MVRKLRESWLQWGYDLIVASRNYDKLTELKAELKNVNVRVITIDLSREQDAIDLYEHLKDEDIDFLVNNAGFGAYGRFLDVPLKKELDLIHTNISAVHILTKCFLQDMVKKNKGYILNVGSSAGFFGGSDFFKLLCIKKLCCKAYRGCSRRTEATGQ